MKQTFLFIIINLLILYHPPFISSVNAENLLVARSACFTGVVEWFDQQNGFGMINPQNGRDEVFVHFSVITSNHEQKVLFPGQIVEFGMVYDDNIGRNRATWVVPKSY